MKSKFLLNKIINTPPPKQTQPTHPPSPLPSSLFPSKLTFFIFEQTRKKNSSPFFNTEKHFFLNNSNLSEGLNYQSDSNKSVHSSSNSGKNLLKGVVFEQKFKVECVNAGISKCSSILKRKKCSEDSNNTIRIQKSITFSLSDNGNNVEEESVPISKPKPQAATLTPKVNKKVEKKKSEVKTKKVASISFLGVLFFMVLFGGLVPLLNVRYGGVRLFFCPFPWPL
ncbi:hypothetical protein P3L10_025035 [Capsicum annuum]